MGNPAVTPASVLQRSKDWRDRAGRNEKGTSRCFQHRHALVFGSYFVFYGFKTIGAEHMQTPMVYSAAEYFQRSAAVVFSIYIYKVFFYILNRDIIMPRKDVIRVVFSYPSIYLAFERGIYPLYLTHTACSFITRYG